MCDIDGRKNLRPDKNYDNFLINGRIQRICSLHAVGVLELVRASTPSTHLCIQIQSMTDIWDDWSGIWKKW